MPGQRAKNKQSITITMRRDLLAWIDEERAKKDMDRSTFIRGIIYEMHPATADTVREPKAAYKPQSKLNH